MRGTQVPWTPSETNTNMSETSNSSNPEAQAAAVRMFLPLDSVDTDSDPDGDDLQNGGVSVNPEDNDQLYNIEEIWDMKGTAPNRTFFIKWEGYSKEHNTWEPESGVGHVIFVREYMERVEKQKEERKRAAEEHKQKKAIESRKKTLKSPGKVTFCAPRFPTERVMKLAALTNTDIPRESGRQCQRQDSLEQPSPKPLGMPVISGTKSRQTRTDDSGKEEPTTSKNQDGAHASRDSSADSVNRPVDVRNISPLPAHPVSHTDREYSDSESGGPDEEFEVESILEMKGAPPNRTFFVKWLNYSNNHNSWEPEDGVKHLDVLKQFLAKRIAKLSRGPQEPKKKRKRSSSDPVSHPRDHEESPESEPEPLDLPSEKDLGTKDRPKVKIVNLYTPYEPEINKLVQEDICSKSAGKKRTVVPSIKTYLEEQERKKIATEKSVILSPDLTPLPFTSRGYKIPQKAVSDLIPVTAKVEGSVKANQQSDTVKTAMDGLIADTEALKLSLDVADETITSAGFDDVKLFRMVIGDSSEINSIESEKLRTQCSSKGKPVMKSANPNRFDRLRKRIAYLKGRTLERRNREDHLNDNRVPPPVTHPGHVIEDACRHWLVAKLPDEEIISNFTSHFGERVYPRNRRVIADGGDILDMPVEVRLFVKNQMKSMEVDEYLAARDGRRPGNRTRATKFIQRPERRGHR